MTAIKTILRDTAAKSAPQVEAKATEDSTPKPKKGNVGAKATTFDSKPAHEDKGSWLEDALKKNDSGKAKKSDAKIKDTLEDLIKKKETKEDPTDIFPKAPPVTADLAKDVIDAYDHDGDGKVDVAKERWRVEPKGDDDAEIKHLTADGVKLLKAADAIGDKDGKVSEEELKAALDKFDSNGDGTLAGDELDTFKKYDPFADEPKKETPIKPHPPIWDDPGFPEKPDWPYNPPRYPDRPWWGDGHVIPLNTEGPVKNQHLAL